MNDNDSKVINCYIERAYSCDSNSDQMVRQSFDRFDDNLVENILSYLTFNEKVLFESVSKRWKKCVYSQQKQLLLNQWEDPENTWNSILEPVKVVDYATGVAFFRNSKSINKVWLKSLIKKCKSIEEIELDCYLDLEALDIICRNCPKLKSITFDTTGLSANDLDHLGNRYGHIFECLRFGYSFSIASYWNAFVIHCKNLKEISFRNIFEHFLEDKNYLPKLEIINNCEIYFNEENAEKVKEKFKILCEKFGQTLTKISLSVYGSTKTSEIGSFFRSICKLKKLKYLYYCSSTDSLEIDQDLINHMPEFSKSCPEVENLILNLTLTNSLKINQIFNALEGFSNLVELDILLKNYNQFSLINGSVECLKSSKNLKLLNIGIECIGEEFFKDIDKHLPNLSDLRISSESAFTDKTIIQLSHLKKLKKFYLYKFQKSAKNITDESVCAVIKGCPVLEQLYFGSRINITNKSIEALICCAKTYPKRRVNFNCGLFHEEDEHEIQSIDMNSFVGKIPENLTIDYMVNN